MIRWKRINLDSGPIHESRDGNFNYKVVCIARGTYEVFQECTPEGLSVEGKPFPEHFEWYYLTNFKSPKEARKFVEQYDSGKLGLTSWEREPVFK